MVGGEGVTGEGKRYLRKKHRKGGSREANLREKNRLNRTKLGGNRPGKIQGWEKRVVGSLLARDLEDGQCDIPKEKRPTGTRYKSSSIRYD